MFLERYFPRSKKLKLKGRINNFQQTPGESISAAWERFTKYFRSVLDHQITENSLLEIFYRVFFYDNGNAVLETITGVSFMDFMFIEATRSLEKVAKTNREWGTRDTETIKSSFSVGRNPKKVKFNQEVLQIWQD